MAYATPLGKQCTETGCDRPATYVVKNNRNETIRECCQSHAEKLVASLSAEEDKARG